MLFRSGTLSLPSATGGANWEGSALDPETGIIYIPSRTALTVLSVAKDENSDLDFSAAFGVRVPRVQGLEIVKPPYGRITAIDMNTGEHLWQIANADTPDSIANHPALNGIDIPRTGVPTRAGLVLTSTLLFQGEGGGGPGASPIFRALNKQTGEILAEIELPNNQSGTHNLRARRQTIHRHVRKRWRWRYRACCSGSAINSLSGEK